jgi:hypothetical protein
MLWRPEETRMKPVFVLGMLLAALATAPAAAAATY